MAWITPAGPQESCAPSPIRQTQLIKSHSELLFPKFSGASVYAILSLVVLSIAFAIAALQLSLHPALVVLCAVGALATCSVVVFLHLKIQPTLQPAKHSHWAKIGAYESTQNTTNTQPHAEIASPQPTPHRYVGANKQTNSTHTPIQSAPGSRTSNQLQGRDSHAELMACMSHEFRTPLNAVIGFTDLMQKELFGPLGSPRYQEYVQHIKDCGSALLRSTEDTLAMTSALTEPGASLTSAEHVHLRQSAQEAWSMVSPARLSQDVTLEIAIEPNLRVLSDEVTIRQVLANLFNEALCNLGPSNKIKIVSTVDQELVQVEVSAVDPSPNRNISIKSHIENADSSLSLCLARTLLERKGLSLLLMPESNGAWRAITILDRAAQKDFFECHGPELNCLTPTNPQHTSTELNVHGDQNQVMSEAL